MVQVVLFVQAVLVEGRIASFIVTDLLLSSSEQYVPYLARVIP